MDHSVGVAARCLRRSPIMSVLMVVGLALGIGVYVTAHGSFRAYAGADLAALGGVEHLEIDRGYRPPPPLDVSRLYGFSNRANILLSWPDAAAVGQHPDVARLFTARALLAVGDQTRESALRYVTPNLLPMFGLETVAGAPMPSAPGAAGDGVWVERALVHLWSDVDLAVGTVITVAGVPRTIRGVVDVPRHHPPVFELPWFAQPGLFVPLEAVTTLRTAPTDRVVWGEDPTTFDDLLRSDDPFVHAWARPSSPAARAAIEATLAARAGPGRRAVLTSITDWHRLVSNPHPAFALFEVFSIVALLAAVFGLSRLLLAQFAARGAETGLRRALGATPLRIFVEHLVEAIMIGVAGGLLGISLGAVGLTLMTHVLPFDNVAFELSWVHAVQGVGLALLAAASAALVPALRAAGTSPARAMGKS